MSKKSPIKNYDPSINIRLPKELKESVQNEAEKRNVTVSKYLRELLESIYSGDYCRKEVVRDKVESFLFSKDFVQLVVWMMSKRTHTEKTETSAELERYISTLKAVHAHVPGDLAREFDKVLLDVIRVRDEEKRYLPPKYTFMDTYSEKEKFNMELLEKFILDDAGLKNYVFAKSYKLVKIPDFKSMQSKKTK